MTTSDFDPDIPVGEPGGYQHQERFGSQPNWTPAGDFDPNLPVGEPGGYQPQGLLGPQPPSMPLEPIPTSSGEFDPNTALPEGYKSRERFGPEPAELGIRFGARLIDAVLCFIVMLLVAASLQIDNGIVLWVLFGVVAYAYFVMFESALGWTPGKKILGLSVHGPKGARRPSLGQSARRNGFLLLLVIPYVGLLLVIIPCIIDAVSIFNSATRQGKHDIRAGGTEVVKG